MSIPLVQNNDKDAINTSIIAIKRNIERINMLLGLVDNDSPDLSGFATKQELQDAVTELQPVDEVTVGNMQSVTSNSVATAINNLQMGQVVRKYIQTWNNYHSYLITPDNFYLLITMNPNSPLTNMYLVVSRHSVITALTGYVIPVVINDASLAVFISGDNLIINNSYCVTTLVTIAY